MRNYTRRQKNNKKCRKKCDSDISLVIEWIFFSYGNLNAYAPHTRQKAKDTYDRKKKNKKGWKIGYKKKK